MSIYAENMIFDIDKFIRYYETGNPSHDLNKIKKASTKDLLSFRKEVKKHLSKPQKHNFATEILPQGYYKFSAHKEVLIPAINYELSKRSKTRLFFWRIKKKLKSYYYGLWRGADLVDNTNNDSNYFGYHSSFRKRGNNLIHYLGLRQYLKEILIKIWKYIQRHHWKIITVIIAPLVAYLLKNK